MFYADVHAHLTHALYNNDLSEVINRAKKAGLGAIICNGTDPSSNRQVLELAKLHDICFPALGIYPIEAIHPLLAANPPYPLQTFDIEEELAFIKNEAEKGSIIAIGECGLDGYITKDPAHWRAQEKVLAQLCEIAKASDLPLIVHTRSLEQRALDFFAELGIKKINFHCFSGRSKHAIQAAEKHGWCFSIPANAPKNESFKKMLQLLPPECVLTETDCPYLAPERGTRNEPSNVTATVGLLAELRGISPEAARDLVWANTQRLFKI